MKVLIEVTAKDIAAGVPGNGFSCPIALAAQRVFGKNYAISVDYSTIGSINDGGHLTRSSKTINRFIRQFDNQGTVKPITITVGLTKLGEAVILKRQKRIRKAIPVSC